LAGDAGGGRDCGGGELGHAADEDGGGVKESLAQKRVYSG
jgi:hypothetical protein